MWCIQRPVHFTKLAVSRPQGGRIFWSPGKPNSGQLCREQPWWEAGLMSHISWNRGLQEAKKPVRTKFWGKLCPFYQIVKGVWDPKKGKSHFQRGRWDSCSWEQELGWMSQCGLGIHEWTGVLPRAQLWRMVLCENMMEAGALWPCATITLSPADRQPGQNKDSSGQITGSGW